MDTAAYSTWLEIDLEAIRGNVRKLQHITERKVMAVVKANGYGHGLVEAGWAALQGGASWLGVARIEEALALRDARIIQPILVFGYTSPLQAGEAACNRISLAVYDLDIAAAYSSKVEKLACKLHVHAKFDSGMGRLGVFPEDGLSFIRRLVELPGLELEGCFTHFARADEPVLQTTSWQIGRFQTLITELSQAGLRPALVHAANSAASLYFPSAYFDMVRCGIAIYGLHPSDDAPLPDNFQAALTWKARLTSVKYLPAGHGVGYSYRYKTTNRERIGAVGVGYADGFRRRNAPGIVGEAPGTLGVGNFVLLGGRRVATAGGVCMDQIMLRLDDCPEARVGDEVVLLGRQGDAVITAEEIGREWSTVNYDVVCGLQARVPRIYLNQQDENV